MYIRRKVFSVIPDPETGEEKLFSTTKVSLEQREYNSKSQKALRKSYDLMKGLNAEGKVVSKSNQIGDIMDGIRGLGRRENQVITKGKTLNHKINQKGDWIGTQATRIRNPKVVGDEVNNSLMKGDKITRRSKGKGEIKEYDHRNSPEFDQYDAKKIMKGEHGFYNYKN